MFKQGILASALAIAMGASSAYASTLYAGPQVFVAAQASNESQIGHSSTQIVSIAGSPSDFDVLASPTSINAAGNQTVTVKGFNAAGFNSGSCTVSSVSSNGTATSSFSQNLFAGNWSINIPFTAAQAPAGNTFAVRCTLLANGRNRIYGVWVNG